MHDETVTQINPATRCLEARCKDCGALVASMSHESQTTLSPADAALQWSTLSWNGRRNHHAAMEELCTTP